jgi:hypothetical protein
MIPAHSVSMLFTLPFTPPCLFQWSQKCVQTLQLWPTHVLSFSYDRLSRSIPDDHCCSLTQVRSRPSSLFEPFLHTPRLQFLIQNT